MAASTTKLSSQGTRFIKLRGNMQSWTTGNSPAASDAQVGEFGFQTSTKQLFVFDGTNWVGTSAFTTSTTTSTTTTSTSTS